MSDEVLYEVDGGVATISFNRPEHSNAQNPALEDRYIEMLRRADDDAEVRAVVLCGRGPRFCVGGDKASMAAVVDAGGWADEITRPLATYALEVRKPVVAAIHGACAGMGLVYALQCDLRFAAPGTKFTTSFVRRGLVAERGESWLLPRVVGQAHALDLLLSGRVVLAEEALAMGLVNRVVEDGDVVAAAQAWARDVALHCSPAAMAAIKAQVYRDAANNLVTSLAESAEVARTMLASDDFREGVQSFVEGREPQFAPLGISPRSASTGSYRPPRELPMRPGNGSPEPPS